jgi:hypothetical protein
MSVSRGGPRDETSRPCPVRLPRREARALSADR